LNHQKVRDLIADNVKLEFLSAGDIHGELAKFQRYLQDFTLEPNVAFAIAAGDYLFQPYKERGEAKKNLKEVFNVLSKSRIPVMVLGGNYEIPGLSYEVAVEYGDPLFAVGARTTDRQRSCPGNSLRIGNFVLLGAEGCNPINGQFPGERSEEELSWALSQAVANAGPFDYARTILITHPPPHESGTRDKLGSFGLPPTYWGKHVGSTALKSFIANNRPLLHICGHVHEGVGTTVYYHASDEVEDIRMQDISKVAVFVGKSCTTPITVCVNHGTLEHWTYFRYRIADLGRTIALEISRRRLGGKDILSKIADKLSSREVVYKRVIDVEQVLPELLK